MARALDPFFTVTGEAHGNFDEIVEAGLWLRQYLRDLIARRRVDPGEDLMSGLIHVEESGDQLTEEEIVATCNLLLIAGHETTVNLIANAVLALLRHPEQWAALRDDPQRVSAVVEETLRYDPPVQLTSRIAADDMTIGDAVVPKGDAMMLLLAAANHDPAAVDRPDVRPGPRHDPASGVRQGPALLPRRAAGAAGGGGGAVEVTARFPNAQMVGEPQYKPNLTLRGMATLAVTVYCTTSSRRGLSAGPPTPAPIRRRPDLVDQEFAELRCRIEVLETQVDHDVVRVVAGWYTSVRVTPAASRQVANFLKRRARPPVH